MRNLPSEGPMQNANDTNRKNPPQLSPQHWVQKYHCKPKRHARGRPRLSLSCMDMYKAANSRCEQPPSGLYHRAKKFIILPIASSVPPITSSRGPPGCPRLPGVSVPPQEPKSECCARSQHLHRNYTATGLVAAVFSKPTWCPA